MAKEKILLVEDDVNFGFVLKSYLEMHDYHVTLVNDGKNVMGTFVRENFNMCVLDVMLPSIDGFTLAKEIRRKDKAVPIIFLTAKSLKEDMVEGFQSGADDYLTKPFDSEVLLMKIQAILRRNKEIKPQMPTTVKIGKYEFSHNTRTLTSNNENHKLTPRESDLLKELYLNKNTVLDRNVALKKIWGDDNYFNARSMDVYITKLRKYWQKDLSVQINNVHGSGFILQVTDED